MVDASFAGMTFFEDDSLELYNLRANISEENNQASKHPEKTQELDQKLIAWRDSVIAITLEINLNHEGQFFLK